MIKEDKTGTAVLPVHITSQDIDELCKQYKLAFQTGQMLRVLAAGLMQKVKVRVYYCIEPESGQFLTAMTLGGQLDDWIEEQMQKENLTEAYLTDILAGRLLMKAYRIWSEMVLKESGIRLGQFHFIGDEIPLEKLPVYLEMLDQSEIHCNEAFAMVPSKTVLFWADIREKSMDEPAGDVMSQDRKLEERGSGGFSCRDCPNQSCPNRNDHPSGVAIRENQ